MRCLLTSPSAALEVLSWRVQTMAQDCRKIFVVPSFVIILLGEIIMAIGGSGAGYQIMYFEVRRHSSRMHPNHAVAMELNTPRCLRA